MDALRLKRNDEKILNDNALAKRMKAAYDENKLKWAFQAALKLLKKVSNTPGMKFFYKYHQTHFDYLASVLTSVEKMAPIDREIELMRANIDLYVKNAGDLLAAVRELPSDPLEGLRNPIALLQIAENPQSALAYDGLLNAYEQATEMLLESALECATQGRAMERDSSAQAKLILDKLKAMPVKTPADQVLIGSNKKRVEFIQFDLMTKVQQSRSQAEDAVKRLEELLAVVRQIDRIHEAR
ncbi:hypothetical protein [Paenibacillus sp.]|uniref:hypothetical protein n=1 Tax=Paenibacillus sp. TaxID=58172 RepID=UPI002D738067|nr:hypothetical protein [Paenibacillus sp.]HZG88108.1 hypothetical protein [Paenibacillus sp.]